MNILCEEDCGPVAHDAGQPSGGMATTTFEMFFEQMKNLSENHTEVISGFLFACFSLIVASTAVDSGIHCSQSMDSNAKIGAGTFKFHVSGEEGMERRYGMVWVWIVSF